MMYSEFIERTGFNERYITYDDYTTYIEPVYMNFNDDKNKFCKKFYKLYEKNVYSAVDLMIAGKSIEEKEAYLNSDEHAFDDIDAAHVLIKKGFLKELKKFF